MDTLVKADIFFFATTIALVLFSAMGLVILVYLVKILRDVRYLFRLARKEADELSSDLKAFRERVREDGFGALSALRGLLSVFRKKSARGGSSSGWKSRKSR